MAIQFQSCVLSIKRLGRLEWEGLSLGSGFDMQLAYDKEVVLDGSIIGLTEDFDLTPPLAQFLTINQKLISSRIKNIADVLARYRHHHQEEYANKADTLSYAFLTNVYDDPKPSSQLLKTCSAQERDDRVHHLMSRNEVTLDMVYERFMSVTSSEVRTWWYIFWVSPLM